MGIAALYSRTIGQFANAVQAGRQEAKAGVQAAAELSARAAGGQSAQVRDSVSHSAVPHAPDSGVRPNASLQAPKAPQGRGVGVNAAGAQRSNLRLAQEPAKNDGDIGV